VKFKSIPLFLALFSLLAFATHAQDTNRVWHNLRELQIEGKGWNDTKNFYDRLPARAEKMVRPPVWSLSQDSAGMCARFITDAKTISARWTLRKEAIALPHMAASGVSGLDLYVKYKGQWRWIGGGRPRQFPTNEAILVKELQPGEHEFLLYLPLYNGVTSVELGIPADAKFAPAPSRNKKPIVFYGTSILHGACASRPGMAYPSMIGRKLDWPIINLGFSGNAKSEPELAQLLAELDPALYVIDPVPNMDAAMIRERVEPFIRTLRKAHPKTPIIMVESLAYTDGFLVPSRKERYTSSNAAFREAFLNLKKSGVKNLEYVTSENLIGDDGEGTVDGTHPNDVGFMRMTEKIGPVVKKQLKK
jgi:lysophospholipase L1-like esterase